MFDESGFSRRINEALRARRIGKMYALAVALKVDESALSRWRRGRPISISNLIRLSDHLRISIDWLLTGVGSMDVAEADVEGAWRSNLIADLSSLDPAMRGHLTEIMKHLAAARGRRTN